MPATKWVGGVFPSLIPKKRYSKLPKPLVIIEAEKPRLHFKNGWWHAKVNRQPVKDTDEHKAYRMACKHAVKLNREIAKCLSEQSV